MEEMRESVRDAKSEKKRHEYGEMQAHPDHGDHDNEMPDQNDTAEDGEMLRDGASLHILESLRELAKKNMPNTITFIPHRMRKRFARVYSSKMNELASPYAEERRHAET